MYGRPLVRALDVAGLVDRPTRDQAIGSEANDTEPYLRLNGR